jgi:rare lipoprotein A
MYVPATPAQSALALTPVWITSTESPVLGRAIRTTLHVRGAKLNVLEGDPASVSGTLQSDPQSVGLPGQVVTLETLRSHGWYVLARARTAATGGFQLRYVPSQTGSERVRLRFAGDAYDLGAHRRLGRLDVYRLSEASWYGGNGSLACGGSLTPTTLGVANRTLPCGTLVTLRYSGRSVRVPVIDRGPYVSSREFDLTQATKQALGFGDTGEVWSMH